MTTTVQSQLKSPDQLYDLAGSTYRQAVLGACTQAFVGHYWGYLTSNFDGAIILQNFTS